LRNLLHEWKLALRRLLQSPTSSGVTILILAVAAGTNTAIYTLADNFLIGRASPEDRVFLVGARFTDPALDYFFMIHESLAPPLREHLASFETIAPVTYSLHTVSGIEHPLRIDGLRVGRGFPEILPIGVSHGRSFAPQDFDRGAERTAILGPRLWRSAFGQDAAAIGKVVKVNGVDFRVIGVLPTPFVLEHGRFDLLLASSFTEGRFLGSDNEHLWLAGLLKRGVSVEQADAEVRSYETSLRGIAPAQYFENNRLGVRRSSQRSHTVSRRQLDSLMSAGAIILATAALNLCGLVLMQLNRRRVEWATRLVLGAKRMDLVRLFTLEVGTLVLCGYLLGLAIGYGLVSIVRERFTGADRGLLALLRPDDIHFNWRIAGWALLACLIVLVLLVITTCIFTRPGRFAGLLKDSSRSATASPGMRWVSNGLLLVQVTATSVLLIVGGFFLVGISRVAAYDYGFSFDGLVRTSIDLPAYRFEGQERSPELVPMLTRVVEAVREVPGVSAAAATKLAFPHWGGQRRVRLADTPKDTPAARLPRARNGIVSPGFLELVGVSVLRGQLFTAEHNRAESEPVTVVNAAFAARYLPDRDPLSQSIEVDGRQYRIIGVVSDLRRWQHEGGGEQTQRQDAAEPAMYFTNAFDVDSRHWCQIYFRTDTWDARLEDRVREAVRRVHPEIAFTPFATLREHFDRTENTFKLIVIVQLLVAGIGTLLSCVAIYLAVSTWVAGRTREIGIRLALGEKPSGIGGRVLSYTAWLVLPAVLVGAVIAYVLLARLGWLRTQFYLVQPTDLRIYAACVAALVLIGLAASIRPMLQAAATDPSRLLHEN
jgi:putative ABC transport system permease protein